MTPSNGEPDVPPLLSRRMRIALSMVLISMISVWPMHVSGFTERHLRLVTLLYLLCYIVPGFLIVNVLILLIVRSELKYIAFPAWLLIQLLGIPSLLTIVVFPSNPVAVFSLTVVCGIVLWVLTRSELDYLRRRDLALAAVRDSRSADEVSSVAHPDLIGQTGETITPLCPSGKVVINGVKHDARSEAEYIDVGQSITVVGLDGFGLIVRPTED